MPDKNRSHGKIDGLPEDIRKEVEAKLLAGCTYEDVSEYLKSAGYEIHYSSVHRFGKPFLKRFESVRLAKEFAQLLAEDNAERPSTELHEANNALASQMLMEIIVDEDMPIAGKMKALKTVAALQQAQVQNERLKIYSRKEAGAVRTAMRMLKERVFKEIQNGYPEIAALMIKIADDVEKEAQGL
jgi:hypothetical protein